ncbi:MULTISPECIES: inositol monophosphatase family protein [Corynebacterium]|nr:MULTISPECIES: inositol monophosphatase family protein [Corynebacterium]
MRFFETVKDLNSDLRPVSDKHILLTQKNTDHAIYERLRECGVDAAHLAEIARDVAAEAARLVEQRRTDLASDGGGVRAAATKSSEVDPVTVVDRESETFIRQRLNERAPGSAILGEEEGASPSGNEQGSENAGYADVLWVVDPIDGTVNFMYGVPAYAVSVAATYDGIPVAGAIADVCAGTVYSTAMGAGVIISPIEGDGEATTTADSLNTVPQPSDPADLRTALIATGFAYHAGRRASQAKLLTQVLPKVRDIRRIGSAALDLVRVATGEVDGYYEHGLGPWDHAAGSLIAARAGAQVTMPLLSVESREGAPICAARTSIADELLNLVWTEAPGGVLHPLEK